MGLCAVLPLLEHLGHFIQATVVKMEDLVLALPAGHHQLAAGTRLITVGTMENNLQGPPSTMRDQEGHGPSGTDRAQQATKCNTKLPLKTGHRGSFTSLGLTDPYGSLPIETFYDCMTWS